MRTSFCLILLNFISSLALRAEVDQTYPGIIDTVFCQENPQQSYALFLPSQYDSSNDSYPVIFFLDPAARGRYPLERFRQAAEEYGFILACSNNSQNGPWEPIYEAVEAMSLDVSMKYRILESGVCLAGFSGGARAACGVASQVDNIPIVIGVGAGFSTPYPLTSKTSFTYLGLCGDKDMNYVEMKRLEFDMKKMKIEHAFVYSDGGHDWPQVKEASIAIEWIALKLKKKQLIEIDLIKIKQISESWLKRADSLDKRSVISSAAWLKV